MSGEMIYEAGIAAPNVDHSCCGAQRGSFEESKGDQGLTLKPTQFVRRGRGVHAIPMCLAIQNLPPCPVSSVGVVERPALVFFVRAAGGECHESVTVDRVRHTCSLTRVYAINGLRDPTEPRDRRKAENKEDRGENQR
jgi:hypothetical protein